MRRASEGRVASAGGLKGNLGKLFLLEEVRNPGAVIAGLIN